MKTLAALVLLILCTFSAKADNPSLLTVNLGNEYTNAYFGFRITKPDTWHAQSEDDMLGLIHRGTAVLAGTDKDKKKLYDSLITTSIPLFGFFEYAPGTPEKKVNSSVNGVAENIQGLPGIRTACDYLSHVKAVLKDVSTVKGISECETSIINGTEFGAMRVAKTTALQLYQVTLTKTHAIGVIQSFANKEGQSMTNAIVQSMRFDKKIPPVKAH